MKNITALTLASAAIVAALSAPTLATANNNSPFMDNNNGVKYEKKITGFWEYAINTPADKNPWFTNGGFCEVDQSGDAWYLAGALGGGTADRECDIPKSKRLVIPVVSQFYGGFIGENPSDDELRDFVSCVEDAEAILTIAELDSNDQVVNSNTYDVSEYNYVGAIVKDLPLEEDSAFYGLGFPEEILTPVIAAGIHVVVEKDVFQAGTSYQVSWEGASEGCGIDVAVSYKLNVGKGGNGGTNG